MKVALVQLSTCADKAKNLEHAREVLQNAAQMGADIIVLPEMFCCEYRNSSFIECKEELGGPAWQMLSESAKSAGVWIVGGSIPEQDGDRLYNTSFVFDREGRQAARCRKMHLFDIYMKNGQYFKESDTFTAGDEVCTFDTEFGKMGLCICFDLRFPELSRLIALDGAQVLFCPASFNMTTGPVHWELLFRGRAVENQIFTCGCAPARDEHGSYISYGNSIISSPWGDVLGRADAEETIILADLDLASIESTRAQLPLMSARRTDIYSIKKV